MPRTVHTSVKDAVAQFIKTIIDNNLFDCMTFLLDISCI